MDYCHRSNQKKIAYLLDSFPELSETFVLQEILELKRQGLPLYLFSLFKPSANKMANGAWNAQLPLTYISHQSRLDLLAIVGKRFFKTPKRLLHTAMLTFAHYHFRLAISYLVCGVFVSEQIECQGITHLHAHFAAGAASVAQVVHLLTDIPYSFTAHAYDIYLFHKSVLTYKMRMAHFVVTCNAYNQHYLKSLVDQRIGERIHCIYYGLNLDIFPSDENSGPTSEKIPLILAVCRLVEKKGVPYLLSACRILKDQGYDFICHIAGDGPQRPLLEQKIHELALADRVKLLGAATHKQVIEMYQQTTVVALPCIIASNGDRDGIPNVLIEALYMRIPVVSTPVAGIPELISDGENGLLVPPQDSSALASALARLLDDPSLRHRLAYAGRETVLERFDLAKNAQCLIELFCGEQKDS
jgi:glycosyltransferase involved in cell wall biosynthesis